MKHNRIKSFGTPGKIMRFPEFLLRNNWKNFLHSETLSGTLSMSLIVLDFGAPGKFSNVRKT